MDQTKEAKYRHNKKKKLDAAKFFFKLFVGIAENNVLMISSRGLMYSCIHGIERIKYTFIYNVLYHAKMHYFATQRFI